MCILGKIENLGDLMVNSGDILLDTLGLITFGNIDVVSRRFGLSDNDTGKREDIRNSLIVANDWLKKYLRTHGYCKIPCSCSVSIDVIVNDYALSKLYLDVIQFDDTDSTNNKSSRYRIEACEALDMFIQNDKEVCQDVSNVYGVTVSGKYKCRDKHDFYKKHNIY